MLSYYSVTLFVYRGLTVWYAVVVFELTTVDTAVTVDVTVVNVST